MLIKEMREIGNRIFSARKGLGLTQAEVAERAGLSDRAYADIERGNVNMRLITMLRICEALRLTPDDVFVEKRERNEAEEKLLLEKLHACSAKEKETALQILAAFLHSLEK